MRLEEDLPPNRFKVDDLINTSILNPIIATLIKAFQLKCGDPIGAGRNRITFLHPEGIYVFKVPHNLLGRHDNEHEACIRGDKFAKCSRFYIRCIAILRMEFVVDIGYHEWYPKWVDRIDGQQVGWTRDGRLVAYDFGRY